MTKQDIEKFIQGPGYVGEWITPSGLERGHVYLAKNGQVMLYLGISSTGLHVFYVMASCYMQCYYDDNYNPHMRIANQEWQITSIAQTVELGDMDISSTMVRQYCLNNNMKALKEMVPENVYQYLYRNRDIYWKQKNWEGL